MTNPNVVSVSWTDHLVFGEGDGRLASPEALRRRMRRWRDELGAGVVHWRLLRARLEGTFYAAPGYEHPTLRASREVDWDDLEVVPTIAHELGLRAYLYVSLFDEGWPLPSEEERRVSYHNPMHGQHVSWQSDFSRRHPEYAVVDRGGHGRQWGVLCLAYPEVRRHFIGRFLSLLERRGFDGLFVCLRSQSRPADFGDQYGYNEPVREEFLRRHGRDICSEDFERQAFRDLLGEHLTRFVAELRAALQPLGTRLAVGCPRGDILGPPLSNATLEWRKWVGDGLVDELVINQNSCRCPSMWHPLWPMHRGSGYLQDYRDGTGLPPLQGQLDSEYGPALAGAAVRLYVARQWDPRSPSEERALLGHDAVDGLVFSSFRFDNPGPVARGDWRA